MRHILFMIAGLLGAVSGPAGAASSEFKPSLRVLIYGDAGVGTAEQMAVAKAMATRHGLVPYDFGLSVGDNWYIDEDNALSKIFEAPYAPLIASGLVLYQTLGNHDHQSNRDTTELEYAKTHPSFGLPDFSYVVSRPELKLVVLDAANAEGTVNLPPDRLKWLETQLCSTRKEPWLALSLHYQIWGTGPRGDFKELKQALLPLLSQCAPDFILSGHEHHAEFMEPMGSTWISIHGNGGAKARAARGASERKSLHHQLEKGFAELNLTQTQARMIFWDTELKKKFVRTKTK